MLRRAAAALQIADFCFRFKLDLCRGIAVEVRINRRKKESEIKTANSIVELDAGFIADRGIKLFSETLFFQQFRNVILNCVAWNGFEPVY